VVACGITRACSCRPARLYQRRGGAADMFLSVGATAPRLEVRPQLTRRTLGGSGRELMVRAFLRPCGVGGHDRIAPQGAPRAGPF
jgi:hypothetical protein